jgi:hypothetical protein
MLMMTLTEIDSKIENLLRQYKLERLDFDIDYCHNLIFRYEKTKTDSKCQVCRKKLTRAIPKMFYVYHSKRNYLCIACANHLHEIINLREKSSQHNRSVSLQDYKKYIIKYYKEAYSLEEL